MIPARGELHPQPSGLAPGAAILLYDGVCGLCSRLVRFLVARDRAARLKFAPLQGAFARDLLRRHGRDPAGLENVYLVMGYGTSQEKIHWKSRAVFAALEMLPGAWRSAGLLRVIPPVLLNALYDLVARVRYRVFGRSERCQLPAPEYRERFIDDAPDRA